jgi:hypothetical protein
VSKAGTSIKTIDWRRMAYNTPGQFASQAKKLLRELHDAQRIDDGWYRATYPKRLDIKNWELKIGYPEDMPPEYLPRVMDALKDAEQWNIKVTLYPISV